MTFSWWCDLGAVRIPGAIPAGVLTHGRLNQTGPISDRMIRAPLNPKYRKLTVIQCYAPINEAGEEKKETWYEQLQLAVSKLPHDLPHDHLGHTC